MAGSLASVYLCIKKQGHRHWYWFVPTLLLLWITIAISLELYFLPQVAYLCATQAGVEVYKTVEQWKAENPGVAETLTQYRLTPNSFIREGRWEGALRLNERFAEKSSRSRAKFSGKELSAIINTKFIIDVPRDEVVAKLVYIEPAQNAGYVMPKPIYCPSHSTAYKYYAFLELGREISP